MSEQRQDGRPEARGGREGETQVRPPRRLWLWTGVPLAVLLAAGIYGHWHRDSEARSTAKAAHDYVPQVHVAEAKRDGGAREVTLPGQTQAFLSANILARATGYIAERHADIGTQVRKGDLLIRIAAPDLDQQLVQARAQLGQLQAAYVQAQAALEQAHANSKLANATKYRATTLAAQGWDTKQNADTQTANASVNVQGITSAQAGIGVALANLRAQQATVDRLVALTGFEQVTAPFDGVVTQRAVEVGDLVTGDASGGTSLFHMDQDDVLRCMVYVPQSAAVGMKEGLPAKVSVPEMQGRDFPGTVSRTAVSLDATSRSLLTEIDIPNRGHVLRPGLYVQIGVRVPRETPVVKVPDAALVFDADGLRVAVLEGEHVRMRKITILRDLGETAELEAGLQGGERVVVNPPADLTEGQPVRVIDAHAAPGGAQHGTGQTAG